MPLIKISRDIITYWTGSFYLNANDYTVKYCDILHGDILVIYKIQNIDILFHKFKTMLLFGYQDYQYQLAFQSTQT